MGRLDREKEAIGFLKVVFSISIAINVSLIAWLYQKFEALNILDMMIVFSLVSFLTLGIIVVNKKILTKIDDLEDL